MLAANIRIAAHSAKQNPARHERSSLHMDLLPESMIEATYEHLRRYAPLYLWVIAAVIAFGRYFTISINISDSLPGTLYLVHKGEWKPKKGDLVAFRYGGGGPYQRGALFLKRMTGLPGSEITTRDLGKGYRAFYVDGDYVGTAKPISKTGAPLKPGPTGTIPPGHFYVAAPHPDSLDSRYALIGWITAEQIVGHAFRIF